MQLLQLDNLNQIIGMLHFQNEMILDAQYIGPVWDSFYGLPLEIIG
jgi:hypothetical protein